MDRAAIVLSGGQYGAHTPLLRYAADARRLAGLASGTCTGTRPTTRPGRFANSAAVLGRVVTAVEDFLDEVVWSSGPG